MATTAATLLQADDLTCTFTTRGDTVEVLRGVSLSLADGDALAITGPSGSGKSTLLHIIGTLERPTSGTLTIDDTAPFSLAEPELARFRNERIGFVFQDHHLLPQFSVVDNVLLPALAHGQPTTTQRERATKLIARVGLEARAHHRPAELSGGERQRVAVARALLNAPRVVLCDEPTGNLDGATAGSVTDLLFELHREESGVLIVVTHSDALAARFGRRAELRDGRLSEQPAR